MRMCLISNPGKDLKDGEIFNWTGADSLLISTSLNPENLLPIWRMRILRLKQPGER